MSAHQEFYRSKEELESSLDYISQSPEDNGTLKMIVRRPEVDAREVLDEGLLSLDEGLVGDNWKNKPSSKTPDNSPHPDMQLNLMNSRCIEVVAQTRDRWPLAGDQLFVDFNLSDENLPPGSKLAIGQAIVEVTEIPHNGCDKFMDRYGRDAVVFVNSKIGKQLHLRGINAKVIKPGKVSEGDRIFKI